MSAFRNDGLATGQEEMAASDGEDGKKGLPAIYWEWMFRAVGTSYVGDNLLIQRSEEPVSVEANPAGLPVYTSLDEGDEFSVNQRYGRLGTFMRPANMIPDSSQTLLFYEARFREAMQNTREFVGVFGGTIGGVPGWHDRGRVGEYNAVLADGHAQRVRLGPEGDMVDMLSFPLDQYGNRRRPMVRGDGWRYDCIPAPPVVERVLGDP